MDEKAPFSDLDFFRWPVIVKPVDSAGSKGVTRVDAPSDLADAIVRGGTLPAFQIREVVERALKRAVMLQFDAVFLRSTTARADFSEIFARIDACGRFLLAYRACPLGYAAFYCNDLKGRAAYLTMLAVGKAQQGAGVGRRLLSAAERTARSCGMQRMRLEVWKENEAAQRFYGRCGYAFSAEESAGSFFMEKALQEMA